MDFLLYHLDQANGGVAFHAKNGAGVVRWMAFDRG